MDWVFERFLEQNWKNAKELADASDILELVPFGPPAPRAVVANFNASCYVKTRTGICLHKGFTVGFRWPENYLSLALPWEIMHFLTPGVFHPNIRPPAICLGAAVRPGTELSELLFRTYELVTFQRRSNPADPLNPEASAWVRRNWPVPPADIRPLKWRAPRAEGSLA